MRGVGSPVRRGRTHHAGGVREAIVHGAVLRVRPKVMTVAVILRERLGEFDLRQKASVRLSSSGRSVRSRTYSLRSWGEALRIE